MKLNYREIAGLGCCGVALGLCFGVRMSAASHVYAACTLAVVAAWALFFGKKASESGEG